MEETDKIIEAYYPDYDDGDDEEERDDELSCEHCGMWCEHWMGDNLCELAIEQQAREDEEYQSQYVNQRLCPVCNKSFTCYQIPTDSLWTWPSDFFNPLIALNIYAIYGVPKGECHHKGKVYHIWIGEGKNRREELIQLLGKGGVMKKQKKLKPITEAEFESLVDKASQPLERLPKPDSKEAGTSESQSSDGCSDKHIHPDNQQGI